MLTHLRCLGTVLFPVVRASNQVHCMVAVVDKIRKIAETPPYAGTYHSSLASCNIDDSRSSHLDIQDKHSKVVETSKRQSLSERASKAFRLTPT